MPLKRSGYLPRIPRSKTSALPSGLGRRLHQTSRRHSITSRQSFRAPDECSPDTRDLVRRWPQQLPKYLVRLSQGGDRQNPYEAFPPSERLRNDFSIFSFPPQRTLPPVSDLLLVGPWFSRLRQKRLAWTSADCTSDSPIIS